MTFRLALMMAVLGSLLACGGGSAGPGGGSGTTPPASTQAIRLGTIYQVQVVWTTGGQSYDTFKVERQLPGGPFIRIDDGTLPQGGTIFNDSLVGLAQELQDVDYRVSGIRGSSETLLGSPARYHLKLSPPVWTQVPRSQGMQLDFQTGQTLADGFLLTRIAADGVKVTFPVILRSAPTILDTTLQENKSYRYQAIAIKGGEQSDATGGGALEDYFQWWLFGPRDVILTQAGAGADLTWQSDSVFAEEVRIYRLLGAVDPAPGDFTPYTPLATLPPSARNHHDTLPASGTYTYFVVHRRGTALSSADGRVAVY